MNVAEIIDGNLLDEATRQFTICNACRYCEGYCPVWPAAHMRTLITNPDSIYLSNLCYDHRDCYYACPFVEPVHEFALNLPKVTRQVRKETYRNLTADFTSTVARKASLLTLAIIPLLAFWAVYFPKIYSTGSYSFYALVPKITTLTVSSGLSAYLVILMIYFLGKYIKSIEQENGIKSLRDAEYLKLGNIVGTLKDVLLHRWFSEIHYPADNDSNIRMVNHLLIFFGFGFDLLSTTLGFVYEDIMKMPSPYSLASPVVIAGLIGGAMIVVGALSSLATRGYSSRKQDFMEISSFDILFVILLLLVAATGLTVLITRLYTAPILSYAFLLVHYSMIYLLVIAAPFTSNFLHIVARFASLLKFNNENNKA